MTKTWRRAIQKYGSLGGISLTVQLADYLVFCQTSHCLTAVMASVWFAFPIRNSARVSFKSQPSCRLVPHQMGREIQNMQISTSTTTMIPPEKRVFSHNKSEELRLPRWGESILLSIAENNKTGSHINQSKCGRTNAEVTHKCSECQKGFCPITPFLAAFERSEDSYTLFI
jgi:hypothetical protein